MHEQSFLEEQPAAGLSKAKNCLEHSRSLRILEQFASALETALEGSILLQALQKMLQKIDASSLRPSSLFFALLYFLAGKITASTEKIYEILEPYFLQSITGRLCSHIPKKRNTLILLVPGLLLGGALYLFPAATGLKYAAAATAGLLALYNTTWGLYLLAGTLPFLPHLSLLLLAGLLAISFLFHRLRSRSLRLLPNTWEPAVVLYISSAAVFTLISVTPAGSLRDFSIHLLSFALFIVLINQLKNKNELYTFILCALLAAFIVSLYGLWQFMAGVPAESAWVDTAQNPLLRTRAYSFFGNPNILAEYLIMLIPFGLALAWTAHGYRKKLLLLAITGTLTLTLLLTFSRGGWLGLAVGLFLFTLLRDKRIFVLLLLMLLLFVLAGAVFMPETILQRVATITGAKDTSNLYRFLVWQEALLIIKDFWATGVGFGHLAFRKIYPFYMISRTKLPYHVHSTYLQILVETGIVGFLTFLWFLISIFQKGLQNLALGHDEFSKNISIAALAATAALLTQGFVEHVLYMPKIIMLFWLNAAFIFRRQ